MYRLPDSLTNHEEGPEAYLPGDLIQHARYGYRGVIVSVDPECLADDGWYYSNQTQPGRHQPWYHVLVDQSQGTTYTAHSSLQLDASKKPVMHPLLSAYFEDFADGHYVRNNVPWPA